MGARVMNGILYGIGTGPGDPELLTIKAHRILMECDVLALPIADRTLNEPCFHTACEKDYREGCLAYQIAVQVVDLLDKKPCLLCPMPMHKDGQQLKAIHDASANAILSLIKEGKTVGFLTIGDPTVYSTYLYIQKRIMESSYEAQVINGVPSFCASAAVLGIPLAENKEQIHIIPSNYDIENAIELPGTKILMKTGKQMEHVKEKVLEAGQQIYVVENCGLKNQQVFKGIESVPNDLGYYTLVIVKE